MINIDAFNQVIAPIKPQKIDKKTKVRATQASTATGDFEQQESETLLEQMPSADKQSKTTKKNDDDKATSPHHRIDITI
ncbi:hypothetical protein [Shewanella marina]|uniref:hypothetical protein n=1 Tax=Shewanella marina TaxID=487319 RepID=UPI000470262D|nr:hypothetical protein [Shewanella marina]